MLHLKKKGLERSGCMVSGDCPSSEIREKYSIKNKMGEMWR